MLQNKLEGYFKISYLGNLKNKFKTAEIIEAPEADNLYLVKYPDAMLIVSIKYLLAFYADGEWHISIGKQSSKTIKQHKELLMKTFTFTRFHQSRDELWNELLKLSFESQIL